ncbi:hypothetical protein ACTG9Q_13285 [Actinokineospora sp. 24-640]
MSSGGIAVVPAAVPVVAVGTIALVGAAAVVAVGAAAVLVVRAANAAVEGGVRAVGDYGARVEARVVAIEAAESDQARWQVVAADVVTVNARIRILRERAAAERVSVSVPDPLRLGRTRSPAEMVRWIAAVQRDLAAAQKALDIRKPPPRLTATLSSAEDAQSLAALDAHVQALRGRYAVEPAQVRPGQVERVLGLLDVDAAAAERDKALHAAAKVVANPRAQDAYMDDLRELVAELNSVVARRRQAATWVATLDDGPLAEVLTGMEPPPTLAGTAERLRAVVRGDSDLTGDLRAQGRALMAWAQDTADQVFVRALVGQYFADQGYTVETAAAGSALRLTRAEWAGEHAGEVWVDGSVVRSRLVREVAGSGVDADLVDRERCAVFANDYETAAEAVRLVDGRVDVEVDRESPTVDASIHDREGRDNVQQQRER